MRPIRLCILWHFHQPNFGDPLTGEVLRPGVWLHAARDYYDLPRLVLDHPGVRVTFNVTPSLLRAIDDYAQGGARDTRLDLARRPAEALSPEDRRFVIDRFFPEPAETLIEPIRRYRELLAKRTSWRLAGSPDGAFSLRDLRDLQVLYYLAYCGTALRADPAVRALFEKGRDYTEADKSTLFERQRALLSQIVPLWRSLVVGGACEVSCSPKYHPILPLIVTTDVAQQAEPGIALPTASFEAPDDASLQVRAALDDVEQGLGRRPVGLWPPDAALSDAVLDLLGPQGLCWVATDEVLLERSLRRGPLPSSLRHRPHRCHGMTVLFRDRALSDRISFVYSRWPTEQAVDDLVQRIEASGAETDDPNTLILLAIDGQSPWDFYVEGGYRFLEALYGRLQHHSRIRTLTVSEALAECGEPLPLDTLAPGSWGERPFSAWIGHPVKNQAWQLLRSARAAFGRWRHETQAKGRSETVEAAVRDLILRSESSDWFSWLGGPGAPRDEVFDVLFRQHLKACYGLMEEPVPGALDLPLERAPEQPDVIKPQHTIHPLITGERDNYFEWLAAGRCKHRRGVLHRIERALETVFFGFDERQLFIRADLTRRADEWLAEGYRLVLVFRLPRVLNVTIGQSGGAFVVDWQPRDPAAADAEPFFRAGRILELSLPLTMFDLRGPAGIRTQVEFHLRVRHGDREVERFPVEKDISFLLNTVDFNDLNWFV